MNNVEKPNCYDCKHRRNIPGDAHSMCAHEKGCGDESNPFIAVANIFSRKNKTDPKGLGIEADPYGMRMGWFLWPFNFDPVWLLKCNGFERKE